MAISAESMRSQFYKRWKKNIVEVIRIRQENSGGGNFFWEVEEDDVPKNKKIFLNINGNAKGTRARKEQGLTSDGENKSHCMALWDTDIQAGDYILWEGVTYRIEQFDKGALFEGQLIFIQFDIVQIAEKPQNG